MTHLATADSDVAFARAQLERFQVATEEFSHLTRHAANSAAALRLPESRFDAARCGVALYGLSPFNTDPAEDGLEPVLSWQTSLAQVKRLEPVECGNVYSPQASIETFSPLNCVLPVTSPHGAMV